jgi:hypothetical protein
MVPGTGPVQCSGWGFAQQLVMHFMVLRVKITTERPTMLVVSQAYVIVATEMGCKMGCKMCQVSMLAQPLHTDSLLPYYAAAIRSKSCIYIQVMHLVTCIAVYTCT